jgi:phage/plasmid-associated DNA primase
MFCNQNVHADMSDSDLHIFAFATGAYDVRERRIRDIKPDDYVRVQADWEYSRERAETYGPEVEDFFCAIFPVASERAFVLRYLAACLSGRREITKILCLNDVHGGNTGKSTFIKLLQGFLGQRCRSCLPCNKLVTKGVDRYGFDAFAEVHLIMTEELEPTMRLNVGLLKTLSNGPDIFVQRKRSSTESIRWQAGTILVFTEGRWPKFDAGDADWLSRMAVVPMRTRFEVGATSGEPLTLPADSSITNRFPLWCSALLDILAENYRPGDIVPGDVPRDTN